MIEIIVDAQLLYLLPGYLSLNAEKHCVDVTDKVIEAHKNNY